MRKAIEMCLQNNSALNVVDAASVETRLMRMDLPCADYGWKGRRAGQSDADGWKHDPRLGKPPTGGLGSRRPAQKKGLAQAAPELGDMLGSRTLLEID